MKLTNKFNIPQTFINVLDRPTYSKGKAHLSVTQLLNSPKIVALTKKFEEEIEQDAADMVWSIFGSAVHNVLEHGKDDNHIVEQRIHNEYEGWNISGAIDLQVVNDKGIDVKDYKTTTVWAVMNEKIEWEVQLNIYAGLVEDVKKIPVTSVGIVAIIRDWNRRESTTREGYPEAPIKELPIRLWSKQERAEFISNRIALHSACEFAIETDGDLPDCTPEEMWEKPTTYAIKKAGNKRAFKVYATEKDALDAIKDMESNYEIEVRKGERTRCENFCPVSAYCQQYQNYMEIKNDTN
jgi:hypothetical protein